MDLGLCLKIISCHDFKKCLAGSDSSIDSVGDPWEMKNVSISLSLANRERQEGEARDGVSLWPKMGQSLFYFSIYIIKDPAGLFLL